ncbi:hypothetical protein BSLG_007373 [Batrachochytrium salamandrivorans]|nr:hypothetical protein BSLG_007373 [Batrachochytrium salamandrivorans]
MSSCNNHTDEELASKAGASLDLNTAPKKTTTPAIGGGGGPAFSFKSSFNFGASEFVPSFSAMPAVAAPAPAPVPAPAPITAPTPASVSVPAASSPPAKSVSLSIGKPAVSKPTPTKTAVAPTEPPKEEEPAKKAPVHAPVVDYNEEENTQLGDGVKEHLNIIFLGHVDAGKSTMGGHILFLTGMVDKRTMEKYEREAKELGRESWYLSWALDLNQEERSKGKTTEYGRGYFETEQRRFTIIDAPGHKTFVPSMLGGAAQADVGVLVISARKGEFETGFEKGGQTREHALLAKTAGVKRLIIVINKMDDPTVEFSKERYDECVGKIMPFIKGVGYQKNDIDVMPVSGFTGANLKDPVDSSICDWYSGPTLLHLLDNLKIERKYSGPLIMPIADKMKGQTIMLMPNKRTAEVTAIFQEDAEVAVAMSGDNVRVRLRGVEEDDVMAGIMCAGYSAVMHMHTAVEEVSITALLHMIDKKTGRKSKHPPKFVKKGDSVIARIEVAQNICNTVAVGKVLKLITDTVPQ